MLTPRRSLQVALSRSARVVAAAAAFGLAATAANANADGKKLALVIGNDNYVKAEHLDNPVYDAHAIADKLTKLGFKVVEGYDVTEAQLRETIGNFVDSLAQADVAVVYYAGHGVTYDNENYLLPTDIELKRVADLDLHALTVTSVLKQMSGYDRINLVILDACRENPFPRELAKTTRAMPARGLAPIDTDRARGTLIVYSTDPMAAAADGGKGEHSPFAQALLDHIDDPDVSLSDMLDSVRAEVDAETHHAQMPWESSSLIGKFKFNPIPANVVRPPPPAGSAAQPSLQTAVLAPPPGPVSGATGAAPTDGQPVVQPKASATVAAPGSAEPPATSNADQAASLEGPPVSGVSAEPTMEPGDPLGEKNLKLAPADVKKAAAAPRNPRALPWRPQRQYRRRLDPRRDPRVAEVRAPPADFISEPGTTFGPAGDFPRKTQLGRSVEGDRHQSDPGRLAAHSGRDHGGPATSRRRRVFEERALRKIRFDDQ